MTIEKIKLKRAGASNYAPIERFRVTLEYQTFISWAVRGENHEEMASICDTGLSLGEGNSRVRAHVLVETEELNSCATTRSSMGSGAVR